MAVLILTSYRSPELVAKLAQPVSSKVGYVVKSDIVDLDVLQNAIERTLDSQPPRRLPQAGVPTITRSQAEVLRLMAEGLSNTAIAEQRGCSIRALERINARLYSALGIRTTPTPTHECGLSGFTATVASTSDDEQLIYRTCGWT